MTEEGSAWKEREQLWVCGRVWMDAGRMWMKIEAYMYVEKKFGVGEEEKSGVEAT